MCFEGFELTSNDPWTLTIALDEVPKGLCVPSDVLLMVRTDLQGITNDQNRPCGGGGAILQMCFQFLSQSVICCGGGGGGGGSRMGVLKVRVGLWGHDVGQL